MSKVDGKPAHSQYLQDDNTAQASTITCNGVQTTVIKRGDRLYLRVADAANPARLHFEGFNWFPQNATYRFTARWVPYKPPHDLHMSNVLGDTLLTQTPGYAEFTLNGKSYPLEPTSSENGLFFVFRDLTSRNATYGAGRFLQTGMPNHGISAPGTLVLDFNQAHNPHAPSPSMPPAPCHPGRTGSMSHFPQEKSATVLLT